ncbi:hypothetical protein B7492_34225 (plasmid) [Bacillus mycoides]|uniref:YopX protein domain-containing protein n=1 Tax=Bacillus mycoides TaxID=1405 RepID=A0A1W6AJQ9_BACMY|nr:YopX family protein [Bacillus mycoides]ARJ26088.1 hypothetical protein B7492_34225 [Bacillus mycoides]
MREIKFRVWCKEGPSMLDWDYLMSEPDFVDFMKGAHEEDAYYSRLMQYTGKKDKDGKEIYEGDSDGFYIVKNGEFPVRCHETFGIIDRAHGWYLDPIDKSTEPSSWEIPLNDFYINRLDAFDKNIYDNPELLEN